MIFPPATRTSFGEVCLLLGKCQLRPGGRCRRHAEIRGLETRLKELAQAIGDLGDGNDVEDLIPIIHRPGWTTEALTAQVRTANELKRTLVEGARMIAEAAGHSVTSTAN